MKIILLLITLMFFHTHTIAFIINNEEPVYYFVDHEVQLKELREKLLTDGVVGITGVTCMGKSEIARKYANDYKSSYKLIIFIDTKIDLISQFITIVKEINHHVCYDQSCSISEDAKLVKESLMNYLKPRNDWLLILDNLRVNENDKIAEFIR